MRFLCFTRTIVHIRNILPTFNLDTKEFFF